MRDGEKKKKKHAEGDEGGGNYRSIKAAGVGRARRSGVREKKVERSQGRVMAREYQQKKFRHRREYFVAAYAGSHPLRDERLRGEEKNGTSDRVSDDSAQE